ncbi:MAG: hypothetical protein JW818_12550 [Pirellulales bacterium]|nr:hypothetical protein [Pirellulales bacterium]
MSIEKNKSGFYEWHDPPEGIPSIGIQTSRCKKCIAYYHEKGFRGLFGNPHFGFRQDNLDFLTETTNAKLVWFFQINIKNVEALYELTELEYFGINDKRPGIDFSRFPKLRTAINQWIKKDIGISKSSIREYHLWHFKPRSKSYDGLEIPKDVRELHLYWANPASLSGLPVLKKLRHIEFHRCRNLEDLSALPTIAPALKTLVITTSSRVDPIRGIVDHPTLKKTLIS